jgi:hypothetical protein
MKAEDVENELKRLKLIHLTESELAAYCRQQLDPLLRARAEAHLDQCFICERQLHLLREENQLLDNREITSEEAAFVDDLMERIGVSRAARRAEIQERSSLQERLAECLRQMVASWQTRFAVALRADSGQEVWRWQSEDDLLRARATIEKKGDLIICVSSNDMRLEGAHINIRLGQFSQKIALHRTSASEVEAKVSVAWRRRPRRMADMSIEIIWE